jgi:hypothetical protein
MLSLINYGGVSFPQGGTISGTLLNSPSLFRSDIWAPFQAGRARKESFSLEVTKTALFLGDIDKTLK